MTTTTSNGVVYSLNDDECNIITVASFNILSDFLHSLYPDIEVQDDKFVFATSLSDNDKNLFKRVMDVYPNATTKPSNVIDISGAWSYGASVLFSIQFDKTQGNGLFFANHYNTTSNPNARIVAVSDDTYIFFYYDDLASTPHQLTVLLNGNISWSGGGNNWVKIPYIPSSTPITTTTGVTYNFSYSPSLLYTYVVTGVNNTEAFSDYISVELPSASYNNGTISFTQPLDEDSDIHFRNVIATYNNTPNANTEGSITPNGVTYTLSNIECNITAVSSLNVLRDYVTYLFADVQIQGTKFLLPNNIDIYLFVRALNAYPNLASPPTGFVDIDGIWNNGSGPIRVEFDSTTGKGRIFWDYYAPNNQPDGLVIAITQSTYLCVFPTLGNLPYTPHQFTLLTDHRLQLRNENGSLSNDWVKMQYAPDPNPVTSSTGITYQFNKSYHYPYVQKYSVSGVNDDEAFQSYISSNLSFAVYSNGEVSFTQFVDENQDSQFRLLVSEYNNSVQNSITNLYGITLQKKIDGNYDVHGTVDRNQLPDFVKLFQRIDL